MAAKPSQQSLRAQIESMAPTGTQILDGVREFSDWEATAEGINIVGGFARFRGLPVFVKRFTNKNTASGALAADQLLGLFPPLKPIGGFIARIDFSFEVAIDRGHLGVVRMSNDGKGKPYWHLVQPRLLGAESLARYVERVHGHEFETRIWLPPLASQPALVRAILAAYLFRMIVGVKDPGSCNFLINDERAQSTHEAADLVVYPVDMGSALSDELHPQHGDRKPWLRANLTGSEGIKQLRELRAEAEKLRAAWSRTAQVVQIDWQVRHTPHACNEKWVQACVAYVSKNLATLGRDFDVLTALPEELPPTTTTANGKRGSPDSIAASVKRARKPVEVL